MNDRLVEAIFRAIKSEPASVGDRWRAPIRAGEIAESYSGEPADLIAAVFGDQGRRSLVVLGGSSSGTSGVFAGSDRPYPLLS